MIEQDGFEEAVLLFEPNESVVAAELRFDAFESLIAGDGQLEQFAASVVKAVYTLVGNALTVQGLVFFTVRVDEEGKLDPSFNLPLRYLVENAGAGPDLGTGCVRVACRGQCPVPWHAVNLWEPKGSGDDYPGLLVQKTIWVNRLGLRPKGRLGKTVEDVVLEDVMLDDIRGEQRKLEERLTETFGEEGKVSLENLIRQHNEQLTRVSSKYRADLENQQRLYLDQIRNCKDEIQRLKAALRNEQERSRRLQQLLRGDP